MQHIKKIIKDDLYFIFFMSRYESGIAKYSRNSHTSVQKTPDVAIWSDNPLINAVGGPKMNGKDDLNHSNEYEAFSGYIIYVEQ